MKRAQFCTLLVMGYLFLIATTMIFSHEGHYHEQEHQISDPMLSSAISPSMENGPLNDSDNKIIRWLGHFHPIFLHFPIALIVMTVISELCFYFYAIPLFDHASRFMIIAAALTSIPTVLFGFALGYDTHYEAVLVNLFWWHRFFGVFTMLLIIATATLRELSIRKRWNLTKIYYGCLALSFLTIAITAYLGGELTFGPGNLLPPFDS